MKRTLYLTLCLAVLLATLYVVPVHAQGERIYVVRPGDSLIRIAARHGLTATQLATANGLRWNAWVYVGQRLRIPGPVAPATGTASGAAPAPAATGGTHVVQRGDSLSKISRRYGVTVAQLAAANGLHHNAWVYIGQKLTIPGPSQGTGASQRTDASQRTGSPQGTATGAASESGATNRAPAAESVGTAGRIYVVRPGDTLLRIAMRHGLTVQRLAMANGVHVNAWVYIGQQIKIPGPSSATGSPDGAATEVPSAPTAATGGTYTVRPGDTLTGIAVGHGIAVSQLAAANGLNTRAWVYVGQRIQIPPPTTGPIAPPPQPAAPRPTPQPAAPQPAPQPANLPAAAGQKWIDVDLTAQTLTAYVDDQAVLHTKVSTGTRRTPTVVGTFRIYSKYRSTSMSGPGYYVPNVPHVMFFFRGYSIHGTYWHSNFGTPMSHGCVNLPQPAAQRLFEWAPVGTKVVTHY